MTQMNLSTKQKQTERHKEQTVVANEEGDGEGRGWEFGAGRCRLPHIE